MKRKAKPTTEELREKFYKDIREQLVCSCGRVAIGLIASPKDYRAKDILVCALHNTCITKRQYYLPPLPKFNPRKPVFNLDLWLEKVKLVKC